MAPRLSNGGGEVLNRTMGFCPKAGSPRRQRNLMLSSFSDRFTSVEIVKKSAHHMPTDPTDVVERNLFIDIRVAGKNTAHSKLWVVRDIAANVVVPISLCPRLCHIGKKQQLHILDATAR